MRWDEWVRTGFGGRISWYCSMQVSEKRVESRWYCSQGWRRVNMAVEIRMSKRHCWAPCEEDCLTNPSFENHRNPLPWGVSFLKYSKTVWRLLGNVLDTVWEIFRITIILPPRNKLCCNTLVAKQCRDAATLNGRFVSSHLQPYFFIVYDEI